MGGGHNRLIDHSYLFLDYCSIRNGAPSLKWLVHRLARALAMRVNTEHPPSCRPNLLKTRALQL